MSSLLTSVQSIRVLLEKSEVYTLERVLELFLPLLNIIAGHYECSVEQILVDALSSHVLKKQTEIRADFDQGIRQDLEMRAEQHCSAGRMIDRLPTSVIGHALSFLTLKDRLPVELTCRSLLTISRNTPAICAEFDANNDEKCARQLFSHRLKPLMLRTTMEMESTDMRGIFIDQVKKLSVDVAGNPNWYPTHDYPKLTTLDVKCAVRDAANDSWALWKSVDDYRVLRMAFRFTDARELLEPPDLMNQITKRKFINGLSIHAPNSVSSEAAIPVSSLPDFSHLSVLHFHSKHISLNTFRSLCQPTLKELVLDLESFSSDDLSRYINDDSFMDLPNLETLSIKIESPEGLPSIIESKGEGWTSLKSLHIRMEYAELDDFVGLLDGCTDIPFLRHVNIIAEEMEYIETDWDGMPDTSDLCGVISKIHKLTKIEIGIVNWSDDTEKLYNLVSALGSVDLYDRKANVTFGYPLDVAQRKDFSLEGMVSVDEITPSHPF